MDLYDFITYHIPLPEGSAGASAKEAAPVLTEKQALIDKVNELEGSSATLKKQRDDLETRLREKESETALHRTETESLQVLIDKLVSSSATLKDQRDDLESRLKKKEDELTRLSADFRTATEATMELEAKHDQALTDNLLLKKNFAEFKSRVKTGLLIVLLLAAALAFFIWIPTAGTDKKAQVKPTKTAPAKTNNPAAPPKNSVTKTAESIAAWPKRPLKLDLGNLQVSVSVLSAGKLKDYKVTLSDNGTARRYYLIGVRTRKGFISEEFLKSPDIAFVNQDNVIVKTGGGGIETKTVYASRVRDENGKKRAYRFMSVVSIKKDFAPGQLVIKGLNRNALIIIIA